MCSTGAPPCETLRHTTGYRRGSHSLWGVERVRGVLDWGGGGREGGNGRDATREGVRATGGDRTRITADTVINLRAVSLSLKKTHGETTGKEKEGKTNNHQQPKIHEFEHIS